MRRKWVTRGRRPIGPFHSPRGNGVSLPRNGLADALHSGGRRRLGFTRVIPRMSTITVSGPFTDNVRVHRNLRGGSAGIRRR